MLHFAQTPVPGLFQILLDSGTLLAFLAVGARLFSVFVLYVYCRGVRSGYVPRWAFHSEAIRRYVAGESLEEMQGPGKIAAMPCFGGSPKPWR